jgi:tetratricopeptide (TPR) repeat protein
MNCFQLRSFQFRKINFFSFLFLSLNFLLFPQLQLIVAASQATANPQTVMASEYPFDCALSLRDKKVTVLTELLKDSLPNWYGDDIDLAMMYVESGNKSKAAELLQSAETYATDSNLTRICLALVNAEQYDRAIKLIDKSQKPENVVNLSALIAKALAEHKQNEKAAALASQTLANLKPVAREAFVLSDIAVAYAKIGQFDKAITLAGEIQTEWAHVKASALCEIADEYTKQGNKSEASTILSQALVTARLIGRDEVKLWLKGEAFSRIAAAYINNGQKAEALNALSEGLKITRQTESQDLSLEKIAIVYAQAKEFDEAFGIAKFMKYKPSELDSYLEIAKELLKDGQQAKALLILGQAFAGTQKIKVEDDTFKFTRLAEIAIVYANANQTAKAYDVLHFALHTIRLESPSSQVKPLIETAKGFYKAKLEIDAESKELLRKICTKEPLPPTQKELDKRRECEAAADRFIERWHQTLDLNILFNEMYVSNPQQRKRNVAMFYGVYKFLSGAVEVKVERGFTDEIFQAGFFAFFNGYYLSDEAHMIFPNTAEYENYGQLPPDILKATEAMKKLLSDKVMTVKAVQKFIEVSNLQLNYWRKKFPPEKFASPTYKASLQNMYREWKEELSEKDFRTEQGFKDFGVKDNVEVYYLRRGVFEFYFIEEAGKLKVLTLGFEL